MEQCAPNFWGPDRFWDAIRAVATVWEAAEIVFFGHANNARFHRFPVGQILRNLSTAKSIGEAVRTFGTQFWKFYYKGLFLQKNAKSAKKSRPCDFRPSNGPSIECLVSIFKVRINAISATFSAGLVWYVPFDTAWRTVSVAWLRRQITARSFNKITRTFALWDFSLRTIDFAKKILLSLKVGV